MTVDTLGIQASRVIGYTKSKTKFTFQKDVTLSTAIDELGFDSLSLVDFVIGLEEEFNIRFPDNTIFGDNIRTVQHLCDIVVTLEDPQGKDMPEPQEEPSQQSKLPARQ